MIEGAFVKIWDRVVGNIIWDKFERVGVFEYDEEFKKSGLDLSPFKIQLHSPRHTNVIFHGLNYKTFKGLPGLLADSLPDSYGNSLINAWIKSQGRPLTDTNPVDKLCFIGTRGMGALEFAPEYRAGGNVSSRIDIESLRQVAEEMLRERREFRSQLLPEDRKALLEILKIGTSAGGARPKAIIAYNPATGEVRSGQADAPTGFSHWILKFDGLSEVGFGETQGYGRVEFAYSKMIKDCGIEMAPCKLYEENGRAHFMTMRFDRDGNKKLHMQSFCALRHYDFMKKSEFSYEQLFSTMTRMGLPYLQREQLFRRMVFNVLAQNCDDHTKNFSFLMDETGRWRFSPAFDVTHSYRPESEWVDQHNMTINGKPTSIGKSDFLKVATTYHIHNPVKIINDIYSVVDSWPDYADSVGVNPRLRDAIYETLLVL